MATVTFDHATRIYPGSTKPAVDDFNLTIGDGEFLVLVGPSGCGKSTSLRMLAGLEDVNSGQIFIGDRDVTDLPPKDRDIAMVFQNYALYPHMTVAENMGFALKIAGTNKEDIKRRVADAAKLLDLEQYLDRKPRALSGGQRQRVAMGRAIVREPQVFLMDETVYVTHDQTEAMTMGDRVAVLKDGLLQQVGTPRELYDRPDNVFVAGFIGSPAMNLMEAPIASDGAHFGGGVFSVERSVLDAAAARGDKSITLGFRPEDLRLTDGGVPVEVLVVEELGADAYVYGEIAQVTGEKKDIVVRVEGRRPPAKGDVIHVSVVEGHSHVFATSTGERLG